MKKLLSIALAIILLLSLQMAFAEEKLKITEKSLFVKDGKSAAFFAKVENVGDKATYVGNGSVVGFDENDEIVATEDYISSLPYGILLQPGQSTYLGTTIYNDGVKKIKDYKTSIKASDYGITYKPFESKAEMDLKGSDDFDNYINVTFTNTDDKAMKGYYIVVAMYDKDNNLIYANMVSDDPVLLLHPNSTMTVKCYVDQDLIKYYEANKIVPDKVVSFVYEQQADK